MRLQLSTDALPERDRIAFWHDSVCRDMMRVTPSRSIDPQGFQAKLDIQMAGRFVLADLQTSHGSVEKTSSDLARGGTDDVLVYMSVKSAHSYQVGKDDYQMTPGDLCIVPMDRHFQGIAGGMSFRSLMIPGAVLNPLMAARELAKPHYLPAGTPLAALLRSSLDAAAQQFPLLSPEMGDKVLGNLTGLVALALTASEEGREAGRHALRAARFDGVKRYIRTNLADPNLDPGRVAAAVGISVRQIHLLFAQTDETFARHVLRRRLDLCRATLADPMESGRTVADVAFGWGFNSLSVFYNAFAAAFGVSPGSVRSGAIIGGNARR